MPASSMCSMTPPMTVSLAVAERVDVDLDRVLQEAIEQQRVVCAPSSRLRAQRALDVALELLDRSAITSIARPPSTYDGPHHQRQADARGHARSPRRRSRAMPHGGALSSSLSITSPKRWRSSARSIASALVPSSLTPACSSADREAQRRLPAELHDHPVGLFQIAQVEHVFARCQTIRRVRSA